MSYQSYLRTSVLSFLLLLSTYCIGQVTAVDYMIEYNSETCLYDCYIIIQEGSATTHIQRTQTPMQFSLAIPTGRSVQIAQSHNPKYNNLVSGTGTDPVLWRMSSEIISPAVNPYYDFMAFQPFISPVGRYDDLHPGDTVKVLSLEITPAVHGVTGVRLWENGVDPSSTEPSMNGSNFSNGFTLGSAVQLYKTNAPQQYPSSYADIVGQYTLVPGEQIYLNPSSGTWTNSTPSVLTLSGSTATASDYGIGEILYHGEACDQAVMLQVTNSSTTNDPKTIIGAHEGDDSSVLDIVSTTKGVRLPRLTLSDLDRYISPTPGLIVYVTDADPAGIYTYNDGGWQSVSDVSSANFSENDSSQSNIQTKNTPDGNKAMAERLHALEQQLLQNRKLLDTLHK